MKQFLPQLKNVILKDVLWILGAYAFGILLHALVVVFESTEPDFTIASVGVLMTIIILSLTQYFSGFKFKQNFTLAVCMSQTRKAFLRTEFLVRFVANLISLLLIFILAFVESKFLLHGIYEGYTIEIDLYPVMRTFMLNPINLLLLDFALVCVKFFVGTIIMILEKFGPLIVWAIYMLFCLWPSFVGKNDTLRNIFDIAIQALTKSSTFFFGYFIQLICLLMIGILFAILLKALKKQAVSI